MLKDNTFHHEKSKNQLGSSPISFLLCTTSCKRTMGC